MTIESWCFVFSKGLILWARTRSPDWSACEGFVGSLRNRQSDVVVAVDYNCTDHSDEQSLANSCSAGSAMAERAADGPTHGSVDASR